MSIENPLFSLSFSLLLYHMLCSASQAQRGSSGRSLARTLDLCIQQQQQTATLSQASQVTSARKKNTPLYFLPLLFFPLFFLWLFLAGVFSLSLSLFSLLRRKTQTHTPKGDVTEKVLACLLVPFPPHFVPLPSFPSFLTSLPSPSPPSRQVALSLALGRGKKRKAKPPSPL